LPYAYGKVDLAAPKEKARFGETGLSMITLRARPKRWPKGQGLGPR
jgi:hypothetical protein